MYSSLPLLWPEASQRTLGEREELLPECVSTFVHARWCAEVPEEEAHPSNTEVGGGAVVSKH